MFAFNSEDDLYVRVSNPTTDIFEARIAAMHPGATAAVALSSGMAAVTSSLINVTGGTGRILASPGFTAVHLTAWSRYLGNTA